ncbi:hypothetical protein PTI98_008565 [Pleurotus ostreatus]|nr:hypothetical protein PTI98_008565 [Pleurotus ostreatus]
MPPIMDQIVTGYQRYYATQYVHLSSVTFLVCDYLVTLPDEVCLKYFPLLSLTFMLWSQRLNYSGFVDHFNNPLQFTERLVPDWQMVLCPSPVFDGQQVFGILTMVTIG